MALGVAASIAPANAQDRFRPSDHYNVDCSFFAATTEVDAFEQHTQCGRFDDTLLVTLDETVTRLLREHFGGREAGSWPACVVLSGAMFGHSYVNYDGLARLSRGSIGGPHCNPIDNGVFPTPVGGGKMGYADVSMKLVHAPGHAYLTPFEGGYAIACKEKPRFERHPPNIEQRVPIGGKCGLIDTDFSADGADAMPFEEARLRWDALIKR